MLKNHPKAVVIFNQSDFLRPLDRAFFVLPAAALYSN